MGISGFCFRIEAVFIRVSQMCMIGSAIEFSRVLLGDHAIFFVGGGGGVGGV